MNTTLRNSLAAGVAVLFLGLAPALLAGGGGDKLPRPMANFSLSREFYLTFPQNLHEGVGPLELTAFIASNYKTKGTIELLGPGKTIVWRQAFTVDSQSVAQILIPHTFNNQCEIQDYENEQPLRKAVHIIADNPIVVYGLDHWLQTADGYLAIPPAAWGTNYRVASYYGITRTDDPQAANIRATSQFALVSAFDGTVVNMLLSDATMNGNGQKTHDKNTSVSVVLNKGEVYQMQALKVAGQYNDLSGTVITSSKLVGLLAGVKCTDVPATFPACDNLLEMLPPTQSWGKEYFTFPFDLNRTAGDSWRVFPLEDGTDIFLNNSPNPIATVSPSDPVSPFYETNNKQRPELKNAAHWTFSKPVLMCQYINGELFDGADHGDPSYVVLETREQFETGVVFATPSDAYGYANYINVMINDSAGNRAGLRDSLYLDGKAIKSLPSGTYSLDAERQIPGTSFWALHIKIPGGVHRLQGQSIFSAYAVGFGYFESYAWACALALKNIGSKDTIPPIIPTKLNCGEMRDTLQDLPHDSTQSDLGEIGYNGIGNGWLYETGKDSTYNFDSTVFVNPANFTPGDSMALIHIKVTNIRQNAHGALYVIDRAGNFAIYYYDYIADTVALSPTVRVFGKIPGGQKKIDTLVLTNPLARAVKVDSIWMLHNTVFKITGITPPPATFPITIPAGGTRKVMITYAPLVDGSDADTVMIKFDCFTRQLARVIGGSGKPCIDVSDIDYGTLTISGGTVSHDSLLVITNAGSDTLIITKMVIGGGAVSAFKVLSPTLPLSASVLLAPGEIDTVKIRFTATASQLYRDSLVVTSNASCTTPKNIGSLIGRGQAPGPYIVPDTIVARVACKVPMNRGITVGNSGSSSDVLDSMLIVGGNIGDFSILGGPQFGLTINAGQSQNFVVTFTPSDTGARSATVRARFTSGNVRIDTLRGTGIHPRVTSQDVDFGQQTVSASTDSIAVALSIQKKYGDALAMNNITITGTNPGDFTFLDKNTPHVLAKGGDTMQVHVRFTPQAAGTRTATLQFHHDGTFGSCKQDTIYPITLTGVGTVPGISVTPWNAGRVFITTTRDGNVTVIDSTPVNVLVDSIWLSQGKYFAIDFVAGRTPRTFTVPKLAGSTPGSMPIYLQFTPVDTVAYYDTVNVRNNSGSLLVKGYIKGVGKVVIYTASVDRGLHGTYGTEAQVPIRVITSGFTRPAPSDFEPLDSGAISKLHIGLQFDRTVMIPIAADNSAIDLGGAITSGYGVTRIAPTGSDSILFNLTGGAALRDSGLLATVRFRTLYNPTIGTPIRDTVSSSVPWVIWQMVPGLFALDSICGLGSVTKIKYSGGASLQQSVPNPATAMNANATVTIPFEIEHEMNVRLAVYNAMGAEVARLVDGPLPKGAYGSAFSIQGVPAGIYYYRLTSDGTVQTRTMMIVH